MLKRAKGRKGFTLVEMLIILAIMGIIAGITIPSVKQAQMKKAIQHDAQIIQMYEKAIEAFPITDYSSTVIYKNNGYIGSNTGKLQGGKATYSSIAALTPAELTALDNSGKGVYPKTKAELTASIKMYGNVDIVHPEQMEYSFFYNTMTKEVELHESGYAVPNYICIDR